MLIVAAHPDDEALGCGATIRGLANGGAEVRALFLTNGVGARGIDQGARRRADACRQAAGTLGLSGFSIHNLPDNQLDTVPLLDIVQIIEGEIANYRPALVITHSAADLNIDHRITREATVTASRPTDTQPVRMVISFEVPSATEWRFNETFRPSLFRDVTATWSSKLAALEHYHEELRPSPHPRSIPAIEAMARLRGSTIGVEWAEAFEIVRLVDRPDAVN